MSPEDPSGRMYRPNIRKATQRRYALCAATAALLVGGGATALVYWEQSVTTSTERVMNAGSTVLIPVAQASGVLRANGVSDIALGGGDITVVDNTALKSDASPFDDTQDVSKTNHITWYVVKEGDSLSRVATMFGVSANTIMWANDLRSRNTIRPGTKLLILPIDGVQHNVVAGDTLERVAKRYGGDTEEIIAYNNLTDPELVVGMVLTVPGGEMPIPHATPRASGVRGGGAALPGYFTHPLPGGVRTQGLHGFNAIDLAAPEGTPITAAAAGTVIVLKSAGWNGGYGTYLVLSHQNGTETLYSHLSQVAVSSGDRVSQGEVIGYVGSTGRSTGNHLHFEVRGAANPF